MNKSKAIEVLARNSANACALAEKYAIAENRDWSGCTDYTFDDNSVLRVQGPNWFSYDILENNYA